MKAGPLKRLRRVLKRWRRRLAGEPDALTLNAEGLPPEPARERRARERRRLSAILSRRPDLTPRITCYGRRDGAGAQAMYRISCMIYAEAHHCRYFHSPFRTMAHAIGEGRQWAEKWEAFLNLGHGEEPVPADARYIIQRSYVRALRHDLPAAHDPGLIVWAEEWGSAACYQPGICRALMPRLRTKYFASDKSALADLRKAGAVNVAVHVRRGDVTAAHYRHLGDAPVLATIAGVRRVIAGMGRSAQINLFSEGTEDMFEAYKAAGCTLHISTDPFTAFHNMVIADVLVTGWSAFSYLPALISDNAVINRRDEPTIERWIGRSPEGTFDEARLASFLERRFS